MELPEQPVQAAHDSLFAQHGHHVGKDDGLTVRPVSPSLIG